MDQATAFVARWLLFPDAHETNHETLKRRLVVIILLTIIRHRRFLYPKYRSCRAGYLTRSELMPTPRVESGWLALYRSNEDRAYITTMSVDVKTFKYILQAGFEDAWDKRTIRRNDVNVEGKTRKGRRSLDAPGALGLLLHYLRSTANGTSLQMIFAIIPATLSRYIESGIPILLEVLRKVPEAAIKWPTPGEMELYSAYINKRHPQIDGAFGFIDGLHVPVAASGNMITENAMWSRWLHSHSISNILVFAPDGTIICARVNAPGSWHDARTSRPVYDKLRDETPNRYFLLADSAFPVVSQGGHPKIQVPLTARSNLNGMSRAEKLAALEYSAVVTSARQAVEWGMRAIQGSFSRLRLPLDANDHEWRSFIMETCLRLHNVRTRLVGMNQIRTVYVPLWTGGQDSFFEELNRAIFPKSNRTRQGTAYLTLEDP